MKSTNEICTVNNSKKFEMIYLLNQNSSKNWKLLLKIPVIASLHYLLYQLTFQFKVRHKFSWANNCQDLKATERHKTNNMFNGGRRGLMDRTLSWRPGGLQFQSRLIIDFWNFGIGNLVQGNLHFSRKSTRITDVGKIPALRQNAIRLI